MPESHNDDSASECADGDAHMVLRRAICNLFDDFNAASSREGRFGGDTRGTTAGANATNAAAAAAKRLLNPLTRGGNQAAQRDGIALHGQRGENRDDDKGANTAPSRQAKERSKDFSSGGTSASTGSNRKSERQRDVRSAGQTVKLIETLLPLGGTLSAVSSPTSHAVCDAEDAERALHQWFSLLSPSADASCKESFSAAGATPSRHFKDEPDYRSDAVGSHAGKRAKMERVSKAQFPAGGNSSNASKPLKDAAEPVFGVGAARKAVEGSCSDSSSAPWSPWMARNYLLACAVKVVSYLNSPELLPTAEERDAVLEATKLREQLNAVSAIFQCMLAEERLTNAELNYTDVDAFSLESFNDRFAPHPSTKSEPAADEEPATAAHSEVTPALAWLPPVPFLYSFNECGNGTKLAVWFPQIPKGNGTDNTRCPLRIVNPSQLLPPPAHHSQSQRASRGSHLDDSSDYGNLTQPIHNDRTRSFPTLGSQSTTDWDVHLREDDTATSGKEDLYTVSETLCKGSRQDPGTAAGEGGSYLSLTVVSDGVLVMDDLWRDEMSANGRADPVGQMQRARREGFLLLVRVRDGEESLQPHQKLLLPSLREVLALRRAQRRRFARVAVAQRKQTVTPSTRNRALAPNLPRRRRGRPTNEEMKERAALILQQEGTLDAAAVKNEDDVVEKHDASSHNQRHARGRQLHRQQRTLSGGTTLRVAPVKRNRSPMRGAATERGALPADLSRGTRTVVNRSSAGTSAAGSAATLPLWDDTEYDADEKKVRVNGVPFGMGIGIDASLGDGCEEIGEDDVFDEIRCLFLQPPQGCFLHTRMEAANSVATPSWLCAPVPRFVRVDAFNTREEMYGPTLQSASMGDSAAALQRVLKGAQRDEAEMRRGAGNGNIAHDDRTKSATRKQAAPRDTIGAVPPKGTKKGKSGVDVDDAMMDSFAAAAPSTRSTVSGSGGIQTRRALQLKQSTGKLLHSAVADELRHAAERLIGTADLFIANVSPEYQRHTSSKISQPAVFATQCGESAVITTLYGPVDVPRFATDEDRVLQNALSTVSSLTLMQQLFQHALPPDEGAAADTTSVELASLLTDAALEESKNEWSDVQKYRAGLCTHDGEDVDCEQRVGRVNELQRWRTCHVARMRCALWSLLLTQPQSQAVMVAVGLFSSILQRLCDWLSSTCKEYTRLVANQSNQDCNDSCEKPSCRKCFFVTATLWWDLLCDGLRWRALQVHHDESAASSRVESPRRRPSSSNSLAKKGAVQVGETSVKSGRQHSRLPEASLANQTICALPAAVETLLDTVRFVLYPSLCARFFPADAALRTPKSSTHEVPVASETVYGVDGAVGENDGTLPHEDTEVATAVEDEMRNADGDNSNEGEESTRRRKRHPQPHNAQSNPPPAIQASEEPLHTPDNMGRRRLRLIASRRSDAAAYDGTHENDSVRMPTVDAAAGASRLRLRQRRSGVDTNAVNSSSVAQSTGEVNTATYESAGFSDEYESFSGPETFGKPLTGPQCLSLLLASVRGPLHDPSIAFHPQQLALVGAHGIGYVPTAAAQQSFNFYVSELWDYLEEAKGKAQ